MTSKMVHPNSVYTVAGKGPYAWRPSFQESRAGLLRARSPANYHRTGNTKVGSLGNLMIGSLPGSACWNRDRAFGRSRTSDGGPLPCHALSAPHERHWRLEGPRLAHQKRLPSENAAPTDELGRGPSSGQMPFIIAQTSRLLRCRSSFCWRRRRCGRILSLRAAFNCESACCA